MQILKRIFTYLLSFFMIAFGALIAAPFLVDTNGYKIELSNGIEQITGAKLNVTGKTEVSFFPSPKVTVTNVYLPNLKGGMKQNMLFVRNVEIESTYMALLTGKVDIKNVNLIRPEIEIEKLVDGSYNWLSALARRANSDNFNLPESITISNGLLNIHSYKQTESFQDIEAEIIILSKNGPFDISAKTTKNQNLFNLKLSTEDLSKKSKTDILVSSQNFTLNFNGDIENKENFTFSGKSSFEISNLAEFSKSFFNNEIFFRNIKSTEKVKAESDFIISNKKVNFENLVVTSDSINARAKIKTSLDHSSVWDLEGKLTKFDIDKLTDYKEEKQYEDLLTPTSKIDFDEFIFDIPEKLSLLFYLSIDETKYKNQTIKNLTIDADLFNKEAAIHNFSASLPGNSEMSFIGTLNHNDIRPEVKGSLRFSGKKFHDTLTWLYPKLSFIPEDQLNSYLFKSNIIATPKNLSFQDISASVDQASLEGQVSIRSGTRIPEIKAQIDLNGLNADAYKIPKQIYEYTINELENPSDDFDLSPLRLFGYNLNINLNASDLVYNQANIENLVLNLSALPGVLSIPRFYYKSDNKGDLNLKYFVNLNKETPELSLEARSLLVDSSIFIPKPDEEKKEEKWSWPEDELKFWGLYKYDGKIDLSLVKLKHNTTDFNNLIFKGNIENKVLSIENLKANLFGGNVEIKGNMSINRLSPSLALSAAISNVELRDILLFLKTPPKASGKIFMSTTFKTYGKSLKEWAEKLTTAESGSRISIRNLNLTGLNLGLLIKDAPQLLSALDLDSLVKQSLNSGTTSFSSFAGTLVAKSGKINFKNFLLSIDIAKGAFAGVFDLISFKFNSLAKISYFPVRGRKITFGLTMQGDILEPQKKLDVSQLERYITEKN